MSKSKYYVVWDGVSPGIYASWTECIGLYNALIHNALQKTMFRALKGGLLGCKRRPFGRRKVPFQNMKGGLLMIRVPPFSSKLILSCFQLVGFMPRRRLRVRL